MRLPALYTLASAPRVGAEGEGSRFRHGAICRRCEQGESRRVEWLHLSLARFHGEALVTTGRSFAVTAALRVALEEAGLRGCAFRAMTVTGEGELPPLEELVITGRAQAASSWWRRCGTCPMCGRPVWRMTPGTTNAIFAAVKGEVGPPRCVYRERWSGDDFFWSDDPGPPFVTERAKEVLDRFAIVGLALHPARFVRDRRAWV